MFLPLPLASFCNYPSGLGSRDDGDDDAAGFSSLLVVLVESPPIASSTATDVPGRVEQAGPMMYAGSCHERTAEAEGRRPQETT